MPEADSEPRGVVVLPPDKTLYFNGFQIAIGMGDVIMTLLRNGTPIMTLNASYTVAKSFGESVTGAIEKLEEGTDHDIMTVETVTKGMESTKQSPRPKSAI
jgi:hypothetical protein